MCAVCILLLLPLCLPKTLKVLSYSRSVNVINKYFSFKCSQICIYARMPVPRSKCVTNISIALDFLVSESLSVTLNLLVIRQFYQCDRYLFFLPSVWELMAGLPGFASHGGGIHLGAGCQYWKFLDVSGTQLQLFQAIVSRDKTLLYTYAFWKKKVFWSGKLEGCETAGSVLTMKILLVAN